MSWDSSKPATNSALVSADMRANWASIEAAIGNPDSATLSIKASQFAVPPTFKPGASAAYDATVSGRVSSNTTSVGNVGGGTDPLMSDIIKADWFSANGRAYRYTGAGTGANNANNKVISATLDGTTIFTSGNFTTEWTSGWELSILVVREDATHAKVIVKLIGFGATTCLRCTYTRVTVANWTTNRTLQINGAATADNDIVQEIGVGEVLG